MLTNIGEDCSSSVYISLHVNNINKYNRGVIYPPHLRRQYHKFSKKIMLKCLGYLYLYIYLTIHIFYINGFILLPPLLQINRQLLLNVDFLKPCIEIPIIMKLNQITRKIFLGTLSTKRLNKLDFWCFG